MRPDTTEKPAKMPAGKEPAGTAAEGQRPTLESIAKLRMIVWEMESEIGLAALGEHERDVLYAIWRICPPSEDGTRAFLSTDLRQSALISGMAPATFYRALSSLRRRGFIRFAPGSRRNRYFVGPGPRSKSDGTVPRRLARGQVHANP